MPIELKHTAVIIQSGELFETTNQIKYETDPSKNLSFAIHYVELHQLELLRTLVAEKNLLLVLFSYDLLDSILDWAIKDTSADTSTLPGLENILALLTENNIPVYFLYLSATEPDIDQVAKNRAKLVRLNEIRAAMLNQGAEAKVISNREAHRHIIRKILS